MTKILIIEDSPIFRNQIRKHLTALGHHCTDAEDIEEGKRILQKNKFHITVIDIRLPFSYDNREQNPQGGFEILKYIQERDIKIESFIITAYGTGPLGAKAIELGANGYIEKDEHFFNNLDSKITQAVEGRKTKFFSLSHPIMRKIVIVMALLVLVSLVGAVALKMGWLTKEQVFQIFLKFIDKIKIW